MTRGSITSLLTLQQIRADVGQREKASSPFASGLQHHYVPGSAHASDDDKSLIAVNIVYAAFTIRGGFNTSVRGISPESSFRVISN
jgi:hypothetical protein